MLESVQLIFLFSIHLLIKPTEKFTDTAIFLKFDKESRLNINLVVNFKPRE